MMSCRRLAGSSSRGGGNRAVRVSRKFMGKRTFVCENKLNHQSEDLRSGAGLIKRFRGTGVFLPSCLANFITPRLARPSPQPSPTGRGSQFGLLAQPGTLPVTGSLSRGERAGVRGRLATGATNATSVGPPSGARPNTNLSAAQSGTPAGSGGVGAERGTRY